MERGSDKHSARMDDALEAEVSNLMRAGHDNRADWNSPEPSRPAVGTSGDPRRLALPQAAARRWASKKARMRRPAAAADGWW